MTTISATTILSSQHSQADKRITTMLWRYPRWIHAEGRTHRLLDIGEDFCVEPRTPSIMECDDLSRNASSSRAIPVEKLIQDILDDTAMPLVWGANQKGMQGGEDCNEKVLFATQQESLGMQMTGIGEMYDVDVEMTREEAWLMARDNAIAMARAFAKAGYHKQIINRLLEPFSHITVVVTATEWSNFLWLRDHKDAEPHIKMLAQAVRSELELPAMQTLKPGEWHLPFAHKGANSLDAEGIEDAKKLSVARCASTSYKTVDGFDMDLERAISLYDKLLNTETVHASPFEHQAQADQLGEYAAKHASVIYPHDWLHSGQWGNFQGFRQFRKMIPNESR